VNAAPTPAAARLSIENLTHRFGHAEVLTDVNLDVQAGEFLTFLGPSGCGKTTTLRSIAGFVTPTEGRIVLDGEDITRVPPHRRPVNMVFQTSTLFPHLDVFENVAFGLRVAKVPKQEIAGRVEEALSLVRLEGFARRRTNELSGGQRQRINLARALANRPRVLLLDEPLSALDLKIRLEMEVELRRVHRELEATFVYVTHDQGEALALSDRIAVFNNGRIEQIDTAERIYKEPVSDFSANFVGDANVISIDVATTGSDYVETTDGMRLRVSAGAAVAGPSWLVIRPEDVRLTAVASRSDESNSESSRIEGVVIDAAFRGSAITYRVESTLLNCVVKCELSDEFGRFEVGDVVDVTWNHRRARLLPARSDGASR
jgi:spermidine/putrescine ABC transporter ATP-binding subunit